MATVAEISRENRKPLPVGRIEGMPSILTSASLEVAPGIFRTPGVCSGDACVGPTRFPVWHLELERRAGASDADQLKRFFELYQSDLDNAWAYVDAHLEEIDRLIRENDESEFIVRTPHVCGGSPRIRDTRIPVWVLEGYRRLGLSEPVFLRNYPTIDSAKLRAALDYADSHRADMDEEIRRNEEV